MGVRVHLLDKLRDAFQVMQRVTDPDGGLTLEQKVALQGRVLKGLLFFLAHYATKRTLVYEDTDEDRLLK